MSASTRKRGLRLVFFGLLALLLVAVVGLVIVELAARRFIGHAYAISTKPIEVATDAATLARGKHLVHAVLTCADCHGADLGGKIFLEGPLGLLSAPNLTPAPNSPVRDYRVEDWDRAIRHGVAPGGRGLIVMPAESFYLLSDADLSAVIAYLTRLPPVERTLPPTEASFLGRALLLFGQLPLPAATIDHDAVGRGTRTSTGTTVEYGAYLAGVSGCRGCHGETLSGKVVAPDFPPAPAIHGGALADWSLEQFRAAVQRGERPDGRKLHALMPYAAFASMTPDETEALFKYVRSVKQP